MIIQPQSTPRTLRGIADAISALSVSSVANHAPRTSRLAPRAITLVELLVVVVILTTLVAGVVPILSPNNDTRKIREASRQLTTYINLAQAKAARTGRQAGIFLKKLSADTGSELDRAVCLEVFQIEQPPAFAGFSEYSTVQVQLNPAQGVDAVLLRFGSGLGSNFTSSLADALPPRMFKVGDVVEVSGYQFRISDPVAFALPADLSIDVEAGQDTENGDSTRISRYNGTVFIDPQTPTVDAVWLGRTSGMLLPPAARPYAIYRLPQLSSAAPFQLPSGICIDLQATGLPPLLGFSSIGCQSVFVNFPGQEANPGYVNNDNGLAVMFSPTGSISSYLWNSTNANDPSTAGSVTPYPGEIKQVFFLIGRRENVPNPITDINSWSFIGSPEEQEEIRKQINWLNLDSRWVVVSANSGRVISSENAFVDLNQTQFSGADLAELELSIPAQIVEARKFAREMKRGGGR